jgi:ABC-type sugar transport system permease subunit
MESDLQTHEIPTTRYKFRIGSRHLRRRLETGQAYLYLLPAFLILGVFSYAPTVLVFFMSPIDWLNDPHWVLISVVTYTTWKSLGFSVVLFMAGLSNISPSLSEAARVDGANPWHIFRYIIWPLIMPITLVVMLLGTIDAFKMFQPVFLLVGPGGGPLNAGRTLGLYLFSEAFATNTRAGRGSAIAVIIFLLVFTIAAAQLGLSRRGTENVE